MDTNNLFKETSSYLLQHANNPVHWYAWGEEAFSRAKKEDKPILVSIGYAACHWCHVMEHESFEDTAVARFMNSHFINIKVDREERPDIDNIYMAACQALTGSGGWPLNMFLTPDLKPFTGGTYFPPKPKYGKPSWMDVLVYVSEAFQKQRDQVEQQASELMEHVLDVNEAVIKISNTCAIEDIFTKEILHAVIANLKKQMDKEYGGFGSAPKFPASMILRFLLRYNYFQQDAEIEKHLELSLRKMMFGGIYDHIGGGFSRYATDNNWMVPHFEKMLYDNALLISLYAEAYMCLGNKWYLHIAEQSLEFVANEMQSPGGGFYASYDADSEGVEGKYYTWSNEEIDSLLADNADFACKVFDIKENGNWEHVNILHRNHQELFQEEVLNDTSLQTKLFEIQKVLFDERSKRIKPGLDDKIILSWNAMMCSAIIQLFKATGNISYLQLAEKTLLYLLNNFKSGTHSNKLMHNQTKGASRHIAYLDDYTLFIQALIEYFEISGKRNFLIDAIAFTDYVLENFTAGDGTFYFSDINQMDVPVRAKEFYDNAVPCGNSVMVLILTRLWHITGDDKYYEIKSNLKKLILPAIESYPTSFGNWLLAVLPDIYPTTEVAITGKNATDLLQMVGGVYYPHIVFVASETNNTCDLPLLKNRFNAHETQIFVCRENVCMPPVNTLSEYISLISEF